MSFETVNGIYVPAHHIFGEIETDMRVVQPGDTIEGFDNGTQGLRQVDRATGALARVAFANAVLGNRLTPQDELRLKSWQFSAEENNLQAIKPGNGDTPVIEPWYQKSKMPSDEMRKGEDHYNVFSGIRITSLGDVEDKDPNITRPFNAILTASMTKRGNDAGRAVIIMSGLKIRQRSGSPRIALHYLRLSEDTSKQWAEQLVAESSEDTHKAAVANLRHVIVSGFHN